MNHRVPFRVTLRRHGSALLLAIALAGTAGCGQSGPLTLPDRGTVQKQDQSDDSDQDKDDTSEDGR